MNDKCTVVIPVYKPAPSAFERASLRQCARVLGRHEFTLCAPRDLDLSFYVDTLRQHGVRYRVDSFDPVFFSKLAGYNALLLTPAFYEVFGDSTHVLIYQLDAWVFRDELAEWMARAYDYVGAPWFEHFRKSGALWATGNGGLSLRRTASAARVLRAIDSLRQHPEVAAMLLDKTADRPRVRFKLRHLFECRPGFFSEWEGLPPEDLVFSFFGPILFPDYRVAPAREAARFAFECSPALLYEWCDRQLPFGCHACEIRDPLFWADHIPPLRERLAATDGFQPLRLHWGPAVKPRAGRDPFAFLTTGVLAAGVLGS